MEFAFQFINWVQICVSTAKFSVVINAELVYYFMGAKELRQGDPISPYLFLLVMEGFFSYLKE